MSVVTDHLTRRGIRFETRSHERTFTSIQEARALGIAADEVAKTVVLDTDHGHVLVAIPGSRKLDMHRVREIVGDKRARLATEHEMKRDYPRFELGAVPPLADLLHTPVFVDEELARHETIVFADGLQSESVQMRTADLLATEATSIASLIHDPERSPSTA
ncbi:MAG TPA: YbaK/EbsC family protein [Actinomycetota bacterium]